VAFDETPFMSTMSADQRLLFQSQYDTAKKNPTTGVLFAVFLGGLGAHHFYMGRTLTGLLYVLLCWTFLPAIFSLLEAFAMPGRVATYNEQRASEIATRIKLLGPAPPASQGSFNIPQSSIGTVVAPVNRGVGWGVIAAAVGLALFGFLVLMALAGR
jgi:TM2 domain-containing membrane protein YozV